MAAATVAVTVAFVRLDTAGVAFVRLDVASVATVRLDVASVVSAVVLHSAVVLSSGAVPERPVGVMIGCGDPASERFGRV